MQIGYREFVDGTMRPVYLDDDNQEYVVADDGQVVYGVWCCPEEASRPVVVRGRQDMPFPEEADRPIILKDFRERES